MVRRACWSGSVPLMLPVSGPCSVSTFHHTILKITTGHGGEWHAKDQTTEYNTKYVFKALIWPPCGCVRHSWHKDEQ